MTDNNPGNNLKTPNVESQPQASPQQQPMAQHQTINIYTQPPTQSPQPPPQSPQPQTTVKPTPSEQPVRPAPEPVPYYYPAPSPAERRRYRLYECFRIFQTVFCSAFLIIGILWSFLSLVLDDFDGRFVPGGNRYKFWSKFDRRDRWNTFFWSHVFVSVFGLIGSCGEILCLQITYAILVTPSFPYCVIPWVIVYGMCNDWGRPRLYYKV